MSIGWSQIDTGMLLYRVIMVCLTALSRLRLPFSKGVYVHMFRSVSVWNIIHPHFVFHVDFDPRLPLCSSTIHLSSQSPIMSTWRRFGCVVCFAMAMIRRHIGLGHPMWCQGLEERYSDVHVLYKEQDSSGL